MALGLQKLKPTKVQVNCHLVAEQCLKCLSLVVSVRNVLTGSKGKSLSLQQQEKSVALIPKAATVMSFRSMAINTRCYMRRQNVPTYSSPRKWS